jgi:hypothetical protein
VNLTFTEQNSVAVEYPSKQREHTFGVCVPVAYGDIDPVRIIGKYIVQPEIPSSSDSELLCMWNNIINNHDNAGKVIKHGYMNITLCNIYKENTHRTI